MEGVHFTKKALLHDFVLRPAQVCTAENIPDAEYVLPRQALKVPTAGHSWEGDANLDQIPLQAGPHEVARARVQQYDDHGDLD